MRILAERVQPFQKAAHRMTVDQLSAKYMVPVRRSILSVFMTRDSMSPSYSPSCLSGRKADMADTMITVAAKPCKEVLQPIYDRLEDESSLLRRAGDVSMLAQALLDVCKWICIIPTPTRADLI